MFVKKVSLLKISSTKKTVKISLGRAKEFFTVKIFIL